MQNDVVPLYAFCSGVCSAKAGVSVIGFSIPRFLPKCRLRQKWTRQGIFAFDYRVYSTRANGQ